MKKTLTAEQERKRAERRARFAALVKQVGAMSDEQRAELASKIMVTNVEGRTLSVRNQMLVAMQLGLNATIVGGFKQWLAQGRCVRKGEHGASILVPIGRKNAETGEIDSDGKHFVSGTVFDISQTELLAEKNGKEGPTERADVLSLACV